MFKYLKET